MHRAKKRLRAWLSQAPQAEYDAAIEVATPHLERRAKAKTYDRNVEDYAFMFPDHRPFAEAARAHLERAEALSRSLVACARTAADCKWLLEHGSFADWNNAPTLVRAMREAALPHLVRYSEGKNTDASEVALALTAYDASDAVTAILRFVDNKSAHKHLAHYFTTYPHARRALEKHRDEAPKSQRKAFEKLLAALG